MFHDYPPPLWGIVVQVTVLLHSVPCQVNTGFRRNFYLCSWNPEYRGLDSGIQLKETGILQTIGIRSLQCENSESKTVLDYTGLYIPYKVTVLLCMENLFRVFDLGQKIFRWCIFDVLFPWSFQTKTVSQDSQSSSDDSESEGESKSEEEERQPRIDTDENHKLTEEEKQWESAGHFQPKKLNTTLMASFLQGDSGDVVPMPKKPHEAPKRPPQTSPEQRVEAPIKAPKDEVETEKIR